MKTTLSLLILLVFTSIAYSEPHRVIFSQAGFSIDILDDKPGAAGSKPLFMRLPAVDGFAANINVQVQSYPGSIDEYRDLTEAQFSQLGWKTISTSSDGNVLIVEYSGRTQGRDLHFYSKAIKVDNLFYLATATDLDTRWPISSAKLKAVVDSFDAHGL